METVARLRGEHVQWKEIKEQVATVHQYRCGSHEALRKQFERWQKERTTSG
jgi:hypothetical protein